MTKRVGIIVAALVFWAAPPASAGPEGVVEMQIDVPAPENLESDLRKKTREKIADRVVERIKSRMDAAGVKFSSVNRIDSSTVKVGIEAEYGRDLLRGIALAPGHLEVRVVRHIGGRWQERASEIPDGVEIRQEGEDAVDSDRAHLWSAERRPLVEYLEEVSFDDVDVLPFSTDDGWRSYALGEAVVTHRHVTGSEIQKIPTGAPYVSLELGPSGQKKFRRAADRLGGRHAVVLDGEIVGFVERSSLTEGSLHLSAPQQVAGEGTLMNWARQIAGRLAAPLPVQLVEVEE